MDVIVNINIDPQENEDTPPKVTIKKSKGKHAKGGGVLEFPEDVSTDGRGSVLDLLGIGRT